MIIVCVVILDQVPTEYRSQLANVFTDPRTLIQHSNSLKLTETDTYFTIGSFSIVKGPHLNEVFVRSLNIILLLKQRTSFQFRLTQLLCLVSSNRRRVVTFWRHQQHHVIY
jgi:hypothetical protein